MSSTRVLKFGGAALRDGDSIRRAFDLVQRHGGPRPIVVVSAAAGVTGLLEALADGAGDAAAVRIRHRMLLSQLDLPGDLLDGFLRELGLLLAAREASDRWRDHLLSFGERMAARLVAAAFRARGRLATPVDAWDLGFRTDRKSVV